ncbi:MAG: (Na+)-NQR maturation NqrM [Gammaproteobacteria bacterium]|nr:(Na+)-NQR maturation NqrM [Gammaproteobacteria bacterium]
MVVFTFMLVIVLLMAVGVVMGRKPISGSCGGMSALGMKSACDACSGKGDCKNSKKGAVSTDGQEEKH